MFKHPHPYPPYIPEGTKKLIVGTLPPPRFSTGKLKPGDIDFNYGSRDGQLWVIIDRIFGENFSYETTEEAILQRQEFLIRNRIGICDIVECAYRKKIDASDIGIREYELRNLVGVLRKNPTIETLLFTGGNSRNGPEFFFRKHLKNFTDIRLKRVNAETPRIHEFELDGRKITTVSLTAPSGAANRAVGSMALYKKMKAQDPNFSAIDFRVLQYAPFFKDGINNSQ